MNYIEGIGDEVAYFTVTVVLMILIGIIGYYANIISLPGFTLPSFTIPSVRWTSVESSDRPTIDVDNSSRVQPEEVPDENVDSDIPLRTEVCNTEPVIPETNEETSETGAQSESETAHDALQRDEQSPIPEESTAEPPLTVTDEIHIRIKSMDDTVRTVTSCASITVGEFKRTHFVEDLANNKTVRIIYNGQLLQDASTLQSCGIVDDCVVHVQVSVGPSRQQAETNSQSSELDLSHLLWPLLTVVLGIFWVLCLKYPQYFNTMSVTLLLLFTGSFFLFCYSQLLGQQS